MQEYEQLFHESDDIAWIAKIDKRYAWLKRHLLDFENRLGKVFPLDWEVSERMTIQFCIISRDNLATLMQKRRTEIDVKLLLYAISKTQQFELLLAKRFNGLVLAAMNITKQSRAPKIVAIDDKPANPADTDASQIGNSPFIGLIGACFEPLLDIYTDSIDRNLVELIERFVMEHNKTKAEFDPITNNSTVFPRFVLLNLILLKLRFVISFSLFIYSQLRRSICILQKMFGAMHSIKHGETNVPIDANFQKISSRICEQNFGAKNTKSNSTSHFIGN